MTIAEHGRQGCALLIFRHQIRQFSFRGFDQPGGEAKLGKGRHQVGLEIGLQCVPPLGILAFGRIGDAAPQFAQEIAGMKILADVLDSLGSAHGRHPELALRLGAA